MDFFLDLPDTEPPAAEARDTRVFVVNLILLVVLGVAVSAWIWRHTDWFAEFAEILALGGIFSWIAFVFRLIQEDRVKTLQTWLDAAGGSQRTTRYLSIAALLAFLASCFVGTAQVESFDSIPRPIRISRLSDESTDHEVERLVPGVHSRSLFFTTWWSRTQVRVKVKGYPSTTTSVWPWRTFPLYVPSSFLRPVIFLKPTQQLYGHRPTPGTEIVIRMKIDNGKTTYAIPFDGHAIWVGCNSDCDIPSSVLDRLRAEIGALPAENRLDALSYWLNPVSAPLPDTIIPNDQSRHTFVFHVEVRENGACTVGTDAPIEINNRSNPYDFVKEVTVENDNGTKCP